jgi:hypothetical protein
VGISHDQQSPFGVTACRATQVNDHVSRGEMMPDQHHSSLMLSIQGMHGESVYRPELARLGQGTQNIPSSYASPLQCFQVVLTPLLVWFPFQVHTISGSQEEIVIRPLSCPENEHASFSQEMEKDPDMHELTP